MGVEDVRVRDGADPVGVESAVWAAPQAEALARSEFGDGLGAGRPPLCSPRHRQVGDAVVEDHGEGPVGEAAQLGDRGGRVRRGRRPRGWILLQELEEVDGGDLHAGAVHGPGGMEVVAQCDLPAAAGAVLHEGRHQAALPIVVEGVERVLGRPRQGGLVGDLGGYGAGSGGPLQLDVGGGDASGEDPAGADDIDAGADGEAAGEVIGGGPGSHGIPAIRRQRSRAVRACHFPLS